MNSPTITRNRTMSREQLDMLKDIFRLLLKEVSANGDFKNLASGELGINYEDGLLYVRNPHTGEIITPNSSRYLAVLDKMVDPQTLATNATMVGGLRIITKFSELKLTQGTATMDNIITTIPPMSNAIFFIDRIAGFKNFNVPARKGILNIMKIDMDNLKATFYDTETGYEYIGRWNRHIYTFMGWITNDTVFTHDVFGTTGGNMITIDTPSPVKDLDVFRVHLHHDVTRNAYVMLNGKKHQLLNINKELLDTLLLANNDIMLILDAINGELRYTFTPEGVTSVVLAMIRERTAMISNVMERLDALEEKVKLSTPDEDS